MATSCRAATAVRCCPVSVRTRGRALTAAKTTTKRHEEARRGGRGVCVIHQRGHKHRGSHSHVARAGADDGGGGGDEDAAAAAAAAAADDDDDDGSVSMSDLIELEVGGVSVSERGFVALLVPVGCKDNLPRAITKVEALRGVVPTSSDPLPDDVASRLVLPILVSQRTEDADGAVSEWAQTLLQLLQTPPIDMGILLPYTALDDLTKMEGSVLGAALIGKATFTAGTSGDDDDDDDAYEFAATLLAGKEFEQNAFDVVGGAAEAFRTLALALRYSPYGARIFATEEALRGVDARHYRGDSGDSGDSGEGGEGGDIGDGEGGDGGGLTLGSVGEAFPRLQTANEARAIAAEARNLLLDPFLSGEDEDNVSSDDVDALGGGGGGGGGSA